MAGRPRNTAKEQSSTSLNHGILDRPPEWPRCNSFSSSSNDSAVFCNNRHFQNSGFQLGKRNEVSCQILKRNRNSSGSSVSSNQSYFSDKDSKKSPVTDSMSVGNKVKDLARLSCPKINSSTFKLQHETLLNCSDRSESVTPFRHNLRRNIRKKTCSCDCTATCTTLVVRRYKEVGRTVKEETVISRTKVQTCVANNATQKLRKVTYEKSYSPSKSDSNRKRRSEVEKLYDSLHEIEWAKNFSPDNILRQIHIRQAASCSMFGSSSPKQDSGNSRPTKRHKGNHEPGMKCTDEMPTETPQTSRSTRSSTLRNRSRQRCHQNAVSQNEAVTNRKHPQNYKNDIADISIANSRNFCHGTSSEVNLIKSPIEQNLGRLNMQQHIKLQNSLNNCKLISNYSESINNKSSQIRSSFDLPNSIATLIPKSCHLNNGPEVDNMELTSEYSLTPTFFDIAEEGICTIDACFREVGAEVVISTCYEGDSDLPLLTSVKDSNVPDKITAVDDGPPVLEPYEVLKAEDSGCSKDCMFENRLNSVMRPCEGLFTKAFGDTAFANDLPNLECNLVYMKSPLKENLNFKSESSLSVVKLDSTSQKETTDVDCLDVPERTGSESGDDSQFEESLVKDTGKRILNKYLRFLRTRVPSTLHETATKKFYVSRKDLMSPVKNKNSSYESCVGESSVSNLSAVASTSSTVAPKSNLEVFYCKSPEKISFDHSKSSLYTYSHQGQESFHNVTSKSVTNKSMMVQKKNCNFFRIEHTSVATTHLPARREHTIMPPSVQDDRECRPNDDVKAKSFTFSYRYQTLEVNCASGYTQVVLQLTHGDSSFFTVESLTELREVLRKSGKDPSCHTLIVNGIKDSFSMGLDLKPLLGNQKTNASTKLAVAVKDFVEALSEFRKPLVAVVNGAAFGLGMTMLNHADTIIASEKATFCMPQTRLGYFPEGGATLTLPKAVGSTAAMDLIMRGRVITAYEAQSIGFISEVCKEKNIPIDLISRVKILAKNTLPSMETTKAMLKMHLHSELLTVLENEVKLLPQMWLSDSCQSALRAEYGFEPNPYSSLSHSSDHTSQDTGKVPFKDDVPLPLTPPSVLLRQ